MKVVSFHPFRQHNFEQAENLSRMVGIQMSLHSTIALPPIFRFLSPRLQGRVLSTGLYLNSHSHLWVFLKYLINRNMESLVESFQKSVIKKLNVHVPDIIIGFDGCSEIVFNKFKGRAKLVLDFTTILDTYNFVINPTSYTEKITYLNNGLKESNYFKRKLKEIELADLIIVGSNQVRNSILNEFPNLNNKISVLNYGYNDKIFYNRKAWTPINCKSVKFLVVGTLSFHKGSDLVLNVWQRIIKINPNVELHICGKCYPEFESYMQTPGIKFHGFVSQRKLSEIMNNCDVLIHPTYVEGLSISVLQALVSGLAIIATSNTGFKLKDKINGNIIDVGSEQQLFDSMHEIIKNTKLIEYYGAYNSQHFAHLTWMNYSNKLRCELLQLLM